MKNPQDETKIEPVKKQARKPSLFSINLNEVNAAGDDYVYDSSNHELRAELADVIATQPFKVNLHILPAGNAYDARGNLETGIPEVCSFCAKEFVEPLKIKFHEILMEGTRVKTDLKGPESDFNDPDLSLTQLSGPHFYVGEYIRELIILAEPSQPLCKPDCKGLCLQCGIDMNEEKCNCAPRPEKQEEVKVSAFSVLKNLKLN